MMLKELRKNIPSLYKKLSLDFNENDFNKLYEYIKKRKRFFTTIIKTKKGKKLFLKIRLQKSRDVIRDFTKEIGLYRLFKENFRGKKIGIILPELISSGKYRNLQWYLGQCQEGNLAGQIDEDFGLKESFLKNSSPEDLANGINSYQSIPSKKIKKLNFYYQGAWWYWQDFNFYQKTFLRRFLSSKLSQALINKKDLEVIKKTLRGGKELLEREARFLYHGDLYPNNIILTPSNKIFILDWGRSNFNNSSFDVAFVYLNAWKNKRWQKVFLKNYLKNQKNKEKFKKLFQISLISITIRLASHCYKYLGDKKTNKKKQAFLAFENHIRELRTALNDLDKIL